MVSCLRWLACLFLVVVAVDEAAAKEGTVGFRTIEAARSDWNAAVPPNSGWERVTLPDDWSRRWPRFDGVVWYRLTWQQGDAARPTALMIDYWTLAGAAYLNGQLLERDPRLVEPLSRSWNAPRRWQLAPPMLREGKNVLLVRVSGQAVYQPGLGVATLGDPARISARYDAAQIVRRTLPTFNLGITVALASFFLAIWLMRRRETAYGWYSMATFAWAGYSLNLVARSPWPFATTDGWARTTIVFLLLFAVSHCLFILRFLDRRYPRAEMLLWAGFAVGALCLVAVPHSLIDTTRVAMSGAAFAIYCGAVLFLFVQTARSRRIDHWVLNVSNVLTIAAGAHDNLTFAGLLDDNIYYSPVTSQMLIICMATVLAWRFVSAATRVERFNEELGEKVEVARRETAAALRRQHELELAGSRMAERIDLVRNLHDGMGTTLVNNIAVLEHGERAVPAGRFLSILKELREELRLIIDTTTGAQAADRSLTEWIAPLRSRLTLLCENQDIKCNWRLDGAGAHILPFAQSLDITRVVQEGVTNALRHSGASEIAVALASIGDRLTLTISDNGRGFDPACARDEGLGLRSMASRAARLGGALDIRSTRDGTMVILEISQAPVNSLTKS
ncbi:hypothetical protein GGC65_001594 [Sphingopyxis sp. OAS728]|nr:hypothetical protein [Sphingopyxis sp. OAS728]